MDRLDFIENRKLQELFHSHKTELSCLENPQTFLNLLRDNDLVPEDRYKSMNSVHHRVHHVLPLRCDPGQDANHSFSDVFITFFFKTKNFQVPSSFIFFKKVINMKSKDEARMAIYKFLEWLERQGSKKIRSFWECVSKKIILNEYPIFQRLDQSLRDELQLPPTDEKEGKGKKKNETSSAKNKERSKNTCGDKEQPGTSSQRTPRQKTFKKIAFGKKTVIWPLFENQLPVTCGKKKGILFRNKLEEGEKCIKVMDQWFTPPEFERSAGKEKSRKWKVSIRYKDIPLEKFIQNRGCHLKSGTFY